jgi:hypothetical protein
MHIPSSLLGATLTGLLFIAVSAASSAPSQQDGSPKGPTLDSRVTALEGRMAVVEKALVAPSKEVKLEPVAAELLEIKFVGKKINLDDHPDPETALYHSEVTLDFEFTGAKALGNKKIKNVKGIVHFGDAFRDEFCSINLTATLDVGAGETVDSKGWSIEIRSNDSYKQIALMALGDITCWFEVKKVIYVD